jgi:hypothetical protein
MVEIRFFLDENISHRLFTMIKRKKIPVESVHSQDLIHIKNGALLEKCNETNSILITFDKDFIRNEHKKHHGILLIDIHPALDRLVVPIFTEFISNPSINKLNWENKIVILTQKGYKIIE